MKCERFRGAVSARLDDEPIGMSAATLDGHLAGCPDCARWAEAAARATRLTRLDVRPVPDLCDEIAVNVALPMRRVARRRRWLRVGLLIAGLAQVLIGLPALTGDSLGMAMSAHAAHEGAAWNLAIGAAFVAAALVPRRAAGLIPLLATFLGVLLVLSVHDVASGAVGVGRLATHAAVVLGWLLLFGLDRAERPLPPGSSYASPGTATTGEGDAGLRTVA